MQSKCCRSIDNGFFYGCILFNNNEMCPFDRALQVCCHPEDFGRRLLGADGAPAGANPSLARNPTPAVAETTEVRISSKPKPSEAACQASCKAM